MMCAEDSELISLKTRSHPPAIELDSNEPPDQFISAMRTTLQQAATSCNDQFGISSVHFNSIARRCERVFKQRFLLVLADDV